MAEGQGIPPVRKAVGMKIIGHIGGRCFYFDWRVWGRYRHIRHYYDLPYPLFDHFVIFGPFRCRWLERVRTS